MTREPRDLLAAHVLGLLEGEERAALERALAGDPALAAEHAEVARHLALYERFPEPQAAPAFAGVERAALAAARAPRAPRIGRWVAAAAAVLVAGTAVLAALAPRGVGCKPGGVTARLGPGIQARDPGGRAGTEDGVAHELWTLAAASPAEVRIGSRVRAVLGAGARLTLLPLGSVALDQGRAYFEVEPGGFSVHTAHGEVQVVGTAFEVDVRDGLAVTVEHGRVRVGGTEIGAGERLANGALGPSRERAGAFFRRPLLRLEGPGSAAPGEAVDLRLVLENPTFVPQQVAGPETVASGVLLQLTGPDERVETRGLDMARAVSGGLPALSPVALGPRERRLTVFSVRLPSAPTGTWRLAALYRPSGEAPLASDPLVLEVR